MRTRSFGSSSRRCAGDGRCARRRTTSSHDRRPRRRRWSAPMRAPHKTERSPTSCGHGRGDSRRNAARTCRPISRRSSVAPSMAATTTTMTGSSSSALTSTRRAPRSSTPSRASSSSTCPCASTRQRRNPKTVRPFSSWRCAPCLRPRGGRPASSSRTPTSARSSISRTGRPSSHSSASAPTSPRPARAGTWNFETCPGVFCRLSWGRVQRRSVVVPRTIPQCDYHF
mmetsp:Transcript_247/g.957  ORF Transcript_247/g.957 Transcript_247/m.957 type:complete len:227 (+) Transcript_247:849-1529(+)